MALRLGARRRTRWGATVKRYPVLTLYLLVSALLVAVVEGMTL